MTFNPNGYVIAEAGTGHYGDYGIAFELADKACMAGADAVKFQIFIRDESLFCPLEGDEKRIARWNASAMPFTAWEDLAEAVDAMGMDFLASVFQPTGIIWLKELSPVAYKVASRAAKTYPYDQVPGPFIISTGMGFPDAYLGNKKFHYLYCVSEYPCPLNKARFIKRTDCYDGLSDHSGTPWPAMDALSRGAEIIEVHVGDKEGPDGPVNLTFEQLRLICEYRDALAEMRAG